MGGKDLKHLVLEQAETNVNLRAEPFFVRTELFWMVGPLFGPKWRNRMRPYGRRHFFGSGLNFFRWLGCLLGRNGTTE
jgi:hypothetical protein